MGALYMIVQPAYNNLMKQEIEVKFVGVDIDDVRESLRTCGASIEQPMRLMRRAVIENEWLKNQNAFLRVRDEGDKVTGTYKQFDANDETVAHEIEIIVDSFDKTIELLTSLDLHPRSYQESKRETWSFGDCEVVIDIWPWLNPYIEIEGPSEKSIQTAAEELGFVWDKRLYGDVMAAYRAQYPHLRTTDTIATIPRVTFDMPLPDLLIP